MPEPDQTLDELPQPDFSTAEEFEAFYCSCRRWTIAEYRQRKATRPCSCGEFGCRGWQALPHDVAADYDREQEALNDEQA